MTDRPHISVVVPLYNEEECVQLLYDRIREACEPIGRPFEIVFVDDGSTDRTLDIARDIERRDARLQVAAFRRNFGQTAAMAASFELARGRYIISMDGDLQNDPVDIPRILARLEEGFDVVCGWRKSRQDKFLTRRLPSIIANAIIGWMTGVHVHDNGCSLKGYRARVIKKVDLYGEMHRFIPAMSSMAGARISEMVVNHHPRRFGESKYGLGRVWRVALDIITIKMIVAFSSRPARWFGLWSIQATLVGLVALGAGFVFLFGSRTEPWLVMTTVALLLLFLGLHFLSLGIIGEHLVSTGDHDPRKMVQPSTLGVTSTLETEKSDE